MADPLTYKSNKQIPNRLSDNISSERSSPKETSEHNLFHVVVEMRKPSWRWARLRSPWQGRENRVGRARRKIKKKPIAGN